NFCVLELSLFFFLFSFTDPPTSEISTLSLHDALPILVLRAELHAAQPLGALPEVAAGHDRSQGIAVLGLQRLARVAPGQKAVRRSEEHTSELQSRFDLVCRLLLEKKKKKYKLNIRSSA